MILYIYQNSRYLYNYEFGFSSAVLYNKQTIKDLLFGVWRCFKFFSIVLKDWNFCFKVYNIEEEVRYEIVAANTTFFKNGNYQAVCTIYE